MTDKEQTISKKETELNSFKPNKKIIKQIIQIFDKHIEKPLKNITIREILKSNYKTPIEQPLLSKYIQFIRENMEYYYNGFIVSDRKGYMLTTNKELIGEYAIHINKVLISTSKSLIQAQRFIDIFEEHKVK